MKTMKLLALLLVVMLLPWSALADEKINTKEELQAYLTQCRENKLEAFVINVPSALGKELSANSNAALDRVMQLAGVTSYDVRISRNTKLTFSNVKYGSQYVAECETVEAVKTTVEVFLQQGAREITLMCTKAVFDALYRDIGMYHLMAQLGVGQFTLKGNGLNMILLSNIQAFNVPHANVSSVSEAGEKIAALREKKAPAFNLVFDKKAYEDLTRDDYRLMAFLGGAEKYQLSYSTSACTLYFTEVTYTDKPSVYCQSEDEVVSAIRAMGAKGCTSFQLMLDEDTYNKVYEGYFKRLGQLQAQAGMTSGDLRYSGVSKLLLFDNAVIQSDAKILSGLAEVTAHVEAAAQRGDKDISMLIDADVYADLMDGVNSFFVSDAKFYDLIANAGICDTEDISFNRSAGAINLRGVQYYAGVDILRAVGTGTASSLTAREQKALAAARKMAAECKRDTDAATALAIHDALCALITYTDDESTDEDDCCIGALLDGKANCDGYADAMMLVGKLAGLNVRFQHGDSLKGGLGSLFSTHMWNLVEIDGTWRMIDVTWDDLGEKPCHLWFNIGEDRASLSHVWSHEMTVPMQKTTDKASRPVAEYTAANADDVTAAALAAQLAGHKVFDVYVTDESMGVITAREALLKGLYGSIYYCWIDALHCLHVEIAE